MRISKRKAFIGSGCAAVVGAFFIVFTASCSQDAKIPLFGMDSRPASECPAPPRPLEAAKVSLERVFGNLTFEYPVAMIQEPGVSGEWYLVEQSGRVRAFSADGLSGRTVLNLRSKVVFKNEAGLLGLAFHPAWQNNRLVFLSYTALDQSRNLTSYISSFRMTGDPPLVDPTSEKIVLQVTQPFYNHNGGGIAFGPDGYLYIGLGDGGSGGDPMNNGQNRNVLLGKILRIDVDRGDPYAIPADNPFAKGGGRPEIFAWGFRNPWRWSFDRDSGDLWVGDVGQNRWEEIDSVHLGGNYGWRIREGAHCFNPDPCDPAGLTDPEVEYSHQEGCSVTAGFVYQGAAIPGLRGTFIFGDYCSGNIWGVVYDPYVHHNYRRLLAASGRNIASFAQGNDGEIYVLAYNGVISKLVAVGGSPDPFPALLSQTGFVQADNPKLPAACLIPYDVNEPFWSDGAVKERFFCLPGSSRVTINDQGHLDFPVGTVFIKHFLLNGKWVETRLFVRHADGEWAGYSYEWNEAESNANLLASGKVRPVGGQSWIYPSRSQCLQCHTAAAGRSLGTEVLQLNRPFRYPASDRTANQLTTYDHIELLSAPLPASVEQLPALPGSTDNNQALGARARSYLHVNCSNCHRLGGTGRGEMELRFDTALPAMNICDAIPLLGDLGIADARILAPGAPGRSVLIQRLKRQDVFRMPPLGSGRPDNAGILLLENWIQGLTDCR